MITRYLPAGFTIASVVLTLLTFAGLVPGLTPLWLTPAFYLVGAAYTFRGRQPPSDTLPRRLRWNLLLAAGFAALLLGGIYAAGASIVALAVTAVVVLPIALVIATVRAWRQARQMARAQTGSTRSWVGPSLANGQPPATGA